MHPAIADALAGMLDAHPERLAWRAHFEDGRFAVYRRPGRAVLVIDCSAFTLVAERCAFGRLELAYFRGAAPCASRLVPVLASAAGSARRG